MAPTRAGHRGAAPGCGSGRRAGMLLPAGSRLAGLAACVPRSEAARKTLFKSYSLRLGMGEERLVVVEGVCAELCSGRIRAGIAEVLAAGADVRG